MQTVEHIQVKQKIASNAHIKIEHFDANKRYTKPHKHNKYLELVFFTAGSGFHFLDLIPLEIKPPITFLIHKNQVHHWHITTPPKGFVMIIKESFLEHISDTTIRVKLQALQNFDKIDVDQNDHVLPLLFEALCLEMKQTQINFEVIESGLKAMLSKLINYSKLKKSSNAVYIEQDFLELLSTTLKNNVAFYAYSLHTSAQNLNAICQKSFQKSASEVIAEFIIKEIKRQLRYTSRTISDIAYELDFKDTSNFSKFFKRHTHLTPSAFRKTTF